MEMNEWVVVASRAQAKIFRRTDSAKPLKWVYSLVNKEGRLKNRELDSDWSRKPKSTSREINMEKFAKQIAGAIKIGADQHVFNKLHVFAEAHLLGRIKQKAPKSLKDITVEWIAKDLEKATADEILERVS